MIDKKMMVKMKPAIDANINLKKSFMVIEIKIMQRYINGEEKYRYFESGYYPEVP